MFSFISFSISDECETTSNINSNDSTDGFTTSSSIYCRISSSKWIYVCHERLLRHFVLSIVCLYRRIYPEQLAALGGLTAYPIAPQPQPSIRYITTAAAPHGQPPGAYTIGYDCKTISFLFFELHWFLFRIQCFTNDE